MTIINDGWLNSNLNIKYNQPFINRISDYTESTAGVSAVFEIAKKGARLSDQIYKGLKVLPPQSLEGFEKSVGVAESGLSLVRIPFVTREAVQSLWSFYEENGIALTRKILLAVRSAMFVIISWGSALALLSANPAYRAMNQTANLTREFSEASMAFSDYQSASELAEGATGLVKEALVYSKNHYLFRLAKNIMAVVSWGFTTLVVALGAPVIPMISAILLSLFVTALVIHKDLHKDSGKFPILSFNRPVIL